MVENTGPRSPPPGGEGRLVPVDALRGLALLGILLVNVHLMAFPVPLVLGGSLPLRAPVDSLAYGLVRVLAMGRFYPLFALLFGLGAALLLRQEDARATPRFARRMAGLFLLGVLHALLLWNGDILAAYGVTGLLLLLFRGSGTSTLLLVASGLLLAMTLSTLGGTALTWLEQSTRAGAALLARQEGEDSLAIQEALRVHASGSFMEVAAHRAREWVSFMLPGTVGSLPIIVAMALLGMALVRSGWVEAPSEHADALRTMAVAGLLVALGLTVVQRVCLPGSMGMRSPAMGLSLALDTLAGPAQALGMVAGGLLLGQRPGWRKVLHPLAAAGRMSLTHYLTHSLALTSLLHGWGLGLYGTLGSAQLVLLATALWATQVAVSSPWLRDFRLGPVEWVWRSFTAGRWLALRRAPGLSSPPA